MTGLSIVVPVHNGEPWIRETVAAILAQCRGRRCEVLLVDDHSRDHSASILAEFANEPAVRILAGPGRGAAAAINLGVTAAQYPLIAQIDQDVTLQSGWVGALIAAFDDPAVAAAQGYYISAPDAGWFARVMNLDLEQRYARIGTRDTDHVCTGNSIYRRDALQQVGLFDETLGYGYDNDISYRLRGAGYRLRIEPAARAIHRWRDGLAAYLTQQYGFGYGRIDLVAKHPHRAGGDAVSPTMMMLHPVLLSVALAFTVVGATASASGLASRPHWTVAAALVFGLMAERLCAGIVAAHRFRDATALTFPVVHLMRDLAWVAAMVMWTGRRVLRRPLRPSDSMTPRPAYRINRVDSAPAPKRPSA